MLRAPEKGPFSFLLLHGFLLKIHALSVTIIPKFVTHELLLRQPTPSSLHTLLD